MKHILFIDDEPIFARSYVRSLMMSRLESQQVQVTLCTDAWSALERIHSGVKFDAIVLDIMMPAPFGYNEKDVSSGLDGGLQFLRKVAPVLAERNIPVIVLSNYATEEIREKVKAVSGVRIEVRSKALTPAHELGRVLAEAITAED